MDQQTLQVVFDCSVKGVEKRLEGPTVSLMEQVLEEAGLEGVWILKDSRRVRRRGRGRFGTTRLESRAGAKSIRIWCKPRGNDTGFEYSLYPPAESDVEMAFEVLRRVNSVTLTIPESSRLPGAVLERLVDVPLVRDLRPRAKCVEVQPEEQEQECMEAPSPTEEPTPDAGEKHVADAGERSSGGQAEVSMAVMALAPEMSMADQEVADRALMAISFVAEGGVARKTLASESIIKHLGIREFASHQEGEYKSVKGSMRALTMALWRRWRYIERVRCSARRGKGVSETIRAYRITEKGERRLESVMGRFPEDVRRMMDPGWRRHWARPSRDVSVVEASSAVSVAPRTVGGMSEIKKMASMHDEAEKQIREIDSVIEATDADIRLLKIELEGLESVEAERRKRIRELEEDLARVARKRAELEESIRKKEAERGEWEESRLPHERERIRVERLMGFSEG